jgi:Glycosyl transferase family 2
MRRICLVTDELYPFTGGGIGRLLHNLVLDSLARSPTVEFHLLLPASLDVQIERIGAYFGERVQPHFAEMRKGWDPAFESDSVYPPAAAFTDSSWHAQSLDFLRSLKRLRHDLGLKFDVIEFPDYRGWAFCTLEEKLLGLDFGESEIVVRIHSTDGILQHFEPREPTIEQLGRFELERKALHDAERVIAHLPGIAEFNADYYAFEPTWLGKVNVSFPPVVYPPPGPARTAVNHRDLLFVTKLQPFKRPELFVRGAAQFMLETPGFGGRAVLACHATDAAYRERIRSLVPADLSERFLLLPSGPEREALLGTSIVVIPSAWESCNLAAYEASAAGAKLVLNGECLAFAGGSPFRDGENCYKFDGTVEGLASTLARAFRQPHLAPVKWTAERPYWLADPPAQAPVRSSYARPMVSVVIPNHNLGRYLPETIASVVASSYDPIEVVVVDDASTEALDGSLIARLEQEAGSGSGVAKVIRNRVNRGLSASRNIGVQAATGKYVLPLDADDCISPRFIELAVAALEARPEFDVVVPSAAYFSSDADLAERRFSDYALFLGDAPSLGMVANRLSCATSFLRRSLFDRQAYDESLNSYEDWSLYLRLAHAGHRFLVTNDIHFHYRRRPRSMISEVTAERHLQLLARILESLPAPLPRSVRPWATLAATLAELRQKDAAIETVRQAVGEARPLRYRVADALNTAVKKVPLVHPFLKASASKLARNGT